MLRNFKWFVVLGCAICLGYSRYRISNLTRTKTEGLAVIRGSTSIPLDEYQFYNRTEQKNKAYLQFKHIVYKDGPCGNLTTPPRKRRCTPFLHMHLYQRESFTVQQGQFGYQLGEQNFSCNIRTCPRPIIVEPLTAHTFWMTDNQEDLIITIRIEPTFAKKGLSRESFENIVGTQRDNYMSLWQALVFIDNIETYPIGSLPLLLTRILIRLGALIGHLLGYQTEYDAYTTRTSSD